jgi:hypothetical protein
MVERVAQTACEWCGTAIVYSGRGKVPSYCSQSHRQRAYELRTAQARRLADVDAGRIAAVPATRVVDRIAPWPTDLRGWERALNVLDEQVRDGTLPPADHRSLDFLLRTLLTRINYRHGNGLVKGGPAPEHLATAARPSVAQLLELPVTKLVDAVLVELDAATRPVTLATLMQRARVDADVARGAVTALQAGGRVRLVGADNVAVDASTVAAHARWRAPRIG